MTSPSPHPDLSLFKVLSLATRGVFGDLREQHRRSHNDWPARQAPMPLRWSPRVVRPVFLVGSPRSGTTFLGECLGRMPGWSYHFEPRLTKAATRQVYNGNWSTRRSELTFRGYYGLLLIANGHGGHRFAEKNPENCFLIPFLSHAYPDATFIQIVRDGRDAAISHAEKPWLRASSAGTSLSGRGGAEWGPLARFWVEPDRRDEFARVSDLERTAWAWRRFTEAAAEGLADLEPDRWLQLRYEVVVSNPEQCADQLANFLGADPQQDLALHKELSSANSTSVGRWRERLDSDQLAAVVRHCEPMLSRLGYA